MKGNITSELINYVLSLKYESLSNDSVQQVKYLALDYIGLAIRGQEYLSTTSLLDGIKKLSDKGKCTVISKSIKLKPEYAALINGASAHSLELDDTTNDASSHPGAVIFSTALAIAEDKNLSGKKIIEAVVAGYEVMTRVGIALNPTAHYERGFHPTGTCGTFGATVTASILLGLTESQTLSALGIAGSQAAGSMAFLNEGAWTKRLHPGWAAHSGIIAATLAKYNFYGPQDIFGGRRSFINGYSLEGRSEKIIENLGVGALQIHNTSIKPHACCRYNQGPIDLIIDMAKNNSISVNEIENINVQLVSTALPIVCEPYNQKINPKSVVDAQFSLPFGIAVALLEGKALLEQYNESKLTNAKINSLMKLVTYESNKDLDKEFPKKWPAVAEVTLKNGEKFKSKIEYPKGDPENKLSWDEIVDKFKYLSDIYCTDDEKDKIINNIKSFELMDNISELMRGIRE